MVFTAEEIWRYLPRAANHTESIHLALLPSAEQMGMPVEPDVSENWDNLLKLRRSVLVHLETARNNKTIGGSLEAKVLLNGAHPEAELWQKYASFPARAIHRLASGNRRAGRRGQERRSLPGHRSRRRHQVRTLLELLDARRRKRRLPHRLRTLRRRTDRNRARRSGCWRVFLMDVAPSARWLWLTLAVVAADRATKYAVESLTAEGFRRVLIPGFAALVHSRNSGMAFGLFGGGAARWFPATLLVIAGCVVLLLVWLLLAGRVGTALAGAGLALLAGGAAGNLLDRLLHGAVTDFVELHAGSFYWPAFNLADSAITIGAALLLLELVGGNSHHAVTQE